MSSKAKPERVEISSEQKAIMWRRHHIDSLLEGAARSFTDKIRMLEGMEEVARAFHGGKLPRSADEHGEQAKPSKLGS